MLEQYLEWRQIKNYAEQTIELHRDLSPLLHQLVRRAVASPSRPKSPSRSSSATSAIMFHYRKPNGDPLSFISQSGPARADSGMVSSWMARHNHILYNPASDIELPRLEHRLPKCVLTPSEAEQVINQTNVNDPLGIRDRAILETFYCTGIRRMEMINLRPYDLDAERGTLIVRQGKGRKDR